MSLSNLLSICVTFGMCVGPLQDANAQCLRGLFGRHRANDSCAQTYSDSCSSTAGCYAPYYQPTYGYGTTSYCAKQVYSGGVGGMMGCGACGGMMDGGAGGMVVMTSETIPAPLPVMGTVSDPNMTALLNGALFQLDQIQQKLNRIQTEENIGSPPSLEEIRARLEQLKAAQPADEPGDGPAPGNGDTSKHDVLGDSIESASRNVYREWSDATGKYSANAKLVSFSESQVTLLRSDGATCIVDLARLSNEDRSYVEIQAQLWVTATTVRVYDSIAVTFSQIL